MNVKIVGGIHERSGDLSSSAYWNHDIAPTKLNERRWALKADTRRAPSGGAAK